MRLLLKQWRLIKFFIIDPKLKSRTKIKWNASGERRRVNLVRHCLKGLNVDWFGFVLKVPSSLNDEPTKQTPK